MKLFQSPCPEKGCDYVGEHRTQAYANVMLGRHKAKVHGIRSLHQIKYGTPKTPRKSEVLTREVPETQQIPNFCPNCGCGLRAVTVAMNLRRKG